jgi:hypothetical protein
MPQNGKRKRFVYALEEEIGPYEGNRLLTVVSSFDEIKEFIKTWLNEYVGYDKYEFVDMKRICDCVVGTPCICDERDADADQTIVAKYDFVHNKKASKRCRTSYQFFMTRWEVSI